MTSIIIYCATCHKYNKSISEIVRVFAKQSLKSIEIYFSLSSFVLPRSGILVILSLTTVATIIYPFILKIAFLIKFVHMVTN